MTNVDELRGWDEIARYLGVSSRTAQSFERDHGLPVRRMPGVKGRVWALAVEIDRWKGGVRHDGNLTGLQPTQAVDDRESNGRQTPEVSFGQERDAALDGASLDLMSVGAAVPNGAEGPHRRKRLFVVLGTLAAGLVVVGATLVVRPRLGQPTSYRVEANILRTFDARGKPVWEYTLPAGASGVYSDEAHPMYGPNGRFAELHGDGKTELLFKVATEAAGHSRLLYCFNAAGKVAWTRSVGRDVTSRSGSTILDNYSITQVGVLSRPRRDGGRIVVVSHHEFSWTSQVAILTADGKQVAEYWHPGWIFGMTVADLDGDGVDEIVLGGLNEGYRSQGYGATLVVLDSRSVSGQGQVPDGDRHQIDNVPAGHEAAVLLFPEFIEKPGTIEPFCFVSGINAIGRHLEFIVGKGGDDLVYVHYQLDRHLRVASVTPSVYYDNLFLAGISPTLRQERIQSTLERVRVLKNRFAEPPLTAP